MLIEEEIWKQEGPRKLKINADENEEDRGYSNKSFLFLPRCAPTEK